MKAKHSIFAAQGFRRLHESKSAPGGRFVRSAGAGERKQCPSARGWLAFVLGGFSLILMLAPALPAAHPTAAKATATYKITAIANIHLRDKSSKDAGYVFGHLLGFERAFTLEGAAGKPVIFYKVNDYQYIEVTPGWSNSSEKRYLSLGYRTTNAEALRAHLAESGFDPQPVHTLADGNLGFEVQDPEGHHIEFVQYVANSRTGRLRGKLLSSRRISEVIIHTGYQVMSKDAEDRFYSAALHFPEMWYGGMKPSVVDWFDRRTVNGPDWIEYMLRAPSNAPLRERGVINHFSLGVYHMHAVYRTLVARGWKPTQKPQIGLDGKWQLNLYTAAGTRIELMGPHPVRKPCCSAMRPGGW